MEMFEFGAARVACRPLGNYGLFEVVFSGPISQRAWDELRTQYLTQIPDATAFLIRLEKASLLVSDVIVLPPLPAHLGNTAPGYVTCTKMQELHLVAVSAKYAESGVRRQIIPQNVAQEAEYLAHRAARLHRQRELSKWRPAPCCEF